MLYFKFNRIPVGDYSSLIKKRKNVWRKMLDKLDKIFCSNPDFDDKIRYVAQWFVEYDNEQYHLAYREIGLDIHHNIIVKMPDERNYGFWLDTNCTIEDFEEDFGIQMITKEEFEELWDSVYYDINAGEFKPMEQSQVLNQS